MWEARVVFFARLAAWLPDLCYRNRVSRRSWTHFVCRSESMRRLIFCAVALLFLTLLAATQDILTGAIRGVVLDPAGRHIAGATIVLVNNATGFRYEKMSDSAGRFAFELLPPGEYSARAVAEGMSPEVSPPLRVNVGGAAEIEFKLAIAGPRESITVSGEVRSVETQPAGLSAVVDEQAILNLP